MTQVGESAFMAPDPQEPEQAEHSKTPVTIRISVFFDGTGNNRANIMARQTDAPEYNALKSQNPGDSRALDSFKAEYSNVSILEEQYENTCECGIYKAFYIEGAGTNDFRKVAQEYADYLRRIEEREARRAAGEQVPEDTLQPDYTTDDNIGFGTGMGETGIYAKVDRAMSEIEWWLMDLISQETLNPDEHRIEKFVVDVSGFSRGAATARHFIHHVQHGTRSWQTVGRVGLIPLPVTKTEEKETLCQLLARHRFEQKNDALNIKFAGLFDTVSSYQVALTPDVQMLHLDAVKDADKVYHLTAAEEHRLCFSLTDIKSAGGKGEEYFLPGVHSDIGGGYRDGASGVEAERFDLMNNNFWTVITYRAVNRGGRRMDYPAFRDLLQREGWYGPDEIWIEHKSNFWTSDDIALKVDRPLIENDYRLIPLKLMAEAMEKEQFSFKPSLAFQYRVPVELSPTETMIRNYIDSVSESKAEDWFGVVTPELNILRHRYLHYSARVALGHWPRFVNKKRYRQRYSG